jgi:spore maturation protein CgeB
MRLLKLSKLSGQILGKFESTLSKADITYKQGLRILHDQCIDFADFYKKHVEERHGCEAEEVVVNLKVLRTKWYQENGDFKDTASMLQYALDRIEDFRPEIIFDHAQVLLPVIHEIKNRFPFVRVTSTWDGWVSSDAAKLRGYDLYFTCVDDIRLRHESAGNACFLNPFGFEITILDRIVVPEQRINRVCFIGSLASGIHNYRNQILESLRVNDQLDWWIGNIGKGLFTRSKVRELLYGNIKGLIQNMPFEMKNRGKLYGLEMYQVLANYSMAINKHVDNVNSIGNMRLVEASGVGTCQIIDWKPNCNDILREDVEAVYYRNIDELKSKVKYLMENPGEAEKIGKAGQKRILSSFTFGHHVDRYMEHVNQFLRR